MALLTTCGRFPIGSGSEGLADKWHNKFRLTPAPPARTIVAKLKPTTRQGWRAFGLRSDLAHSLPRDEPASRLDRVKDALDAGLQIAAGGVPLALSIPDWASFGFPDTAAGAAEEA